MDIRLSIDTARIRPDFADYGQASLVAAVRGINRTMANVKTAMVRPISAALKIKQAYVRERIRTVDATASRPVALMYASNTPIPIIEFNARGPEPSRGRGRGVTANTQQRRYPQAFIATMRSGHRGVFQRKGQKRLEIRELREASIAAVFLKHAAVGQARADEQLPKNLEAELKFALRK
jgi:hypothetical protein